MIDSMLLKNDEKSIYNLRSLYKKYGYLPFKMSKFEEYDLYVRNKDFLVSDSVITFNDTTGRLLALKPDVTLSIIKNSSYESGCKQKLYYNENVYRISGSTHHFKEIMQTGIECIGDVDLNDIFEIVYLAAKSLDTISSNFVLDVSHMGLFSAVLDELSDDKVFKKEITKLISNKNEHEALELCKANGISHDGIQNIMRLISLYGDSSVVLSELKVIAHSEAAKQAYSELSLLCDLLNNTEYKDRIKLDFSVVNNMNYYNGFVFKGFLSGISESVLSGGEYGKLMKRMGKSGNAIGFAIYLDLLEALEDNPSNYDVDILLIYTEKSAAETVITTKNDFLERGFSVSIQKKIPQNLRYKEIIYIDKD